ncbi:peptide ABC transporter permease [Paenibacillus rigui]|uniref:Peptide ABC transporter permease n=2 Tax=Paenibacillus rigui TaxID=554312 RepID=A0A229UP86_9BACL|nr:peptide ABC transporter permease [Paenibacillus rigui]
MLRMEDAPPRLRRSGIRLNGRQRAVGFMLLTALFILGIVLCSLLLGVESMAVQLEQRNLAPSWDHPFGTDWLGRDMFTRTVKGLALSMGVGLIAAGSSAVIAAVMGLAAATMGNTADRLISWLIDLFLSVPHLVTLILLAFVSGGGMKGIIIGVAFTHWPSLARVIRAEMLQLRTSEYVQISRRLGKSRWWVATRHMVPHLVPQLFVGLLLLFPHAILHEAGVTFVGLGLSPHQPAIGIILSESMRYLSTGMWWLALFPGLSLLLVVRAFDVLGGSLRAMLDPHRSRL